MDIPKGLKKEFKKSFAQYIKAMGRNVDVILKPHTVRCPNCIYDSVQKKSTNIYDLNFLRPVTVFPTTSYKRIVYPAPFNVTTISGVTFNPDIPNARILQTDTCPICNGDGVLRAENKTCMKAVVNRVSNQTNTEGSKTFDLSAGRDGYEILRVKTLPSNYAICRDAQVLIIDGVKTKLEVPAMLKGIGIDALVELYVSVVSEDSSSTVAYDKDTRINTSDNGQISDQASQSTPTIPPVIPGDDVW